MKKYIQVVSFKTKEVVKELDVSGKTDKQIGIIDNGINRNLNHEDYYTIESNESRKA